jgi:L-iditol 2-dehydrogenase
MSMRAARLYGPRDLRVDTVDDPVTAPGEYLLRVRAVSVCGSDLHYYLEGGIGSAQVREPFTPGHEFAAEVVAGPDGLAPGTLVAVDPARPCGYCEWCHAGHPNLCPNVVFTGAPPYPGALSEYIGAPASTLFAVPASFDATTAALLEPLGVAIHALDLARLRPLESVAVLGAGPIGLLLQQVAATSGAGDIYVIDPLQYRCDVAAQLGATATATERTAILDWTAGRGVDVVLEATNSPHGPQHAAEVVRIGGRLILVGIPEGDFFGFDASLVRRKGLTIKLSRRMGHVYPRAIKLVAGGRVNLAPLATHHFPLAKAPEAFALQAACDDGVIKTVIEP